MKLAIMQPYLFPYIGYFQLIHAVDEFVVFDDVNFIKKGWVNRNNLLVGGKPYLFTVPLIKASQNKKINEISLSEDNKWKKSFLKTLEQAYKKAPYFEDSFVVIENIINNTESNLADYIYSSLQELMRYLKINTLLSRSSELQKNETLKGKDKIIEICSLKDSRIYINAIGGVDLYNKQDFKVIDCELKFIKAEEVNYKQFKNDFVPYLSIIDLMMFNSPEEMQVILSRYSLI